MNSSVMRIIKPAPTATSLVLLLLRLGFGGMMCFGHGWDKIQKFGGTPSTFPIDPLKLGASLSFYATVATEFGCALLVALGLLTRVACAPLIFAMCIAFFQVHGGRLTFVPSAGASEPAVVYVVAFCVILLGGPGKFSLDQALLSGKSGKA
jgi:putative oxidoreductase